jgi:hypothetical protein
MCIKKPDHELTSTIHLGVRAVVNNSDASHLADSLAKLSEEERGVLSNLAKSDAMLIIHRGQGKGSRFLLSASESETKLGRASESGIFLDDVTVSRKHAEISTENGKFVLKDCGSLNGTYVNGEPTVTAILNSGDEIQIGKFHMIFFGGNI